MNVLRITFIFSYSINEGLCSKYPSTIPTHHYFTVVMMNREQSVQGSDTTKLNSISKAG